MRANGIVANNLARYMSERGWRAHALARRLHRFEEAGFSKIEFNGVAGLRAYAGGRL